MVTTNVIFLFERVLMGFSSCVRRLSYHTADKDDVPHTFVTFVEAKCWLLSRVNPGVNEDYFTDETFLNKTGGLETGTGLGCLEPCNNTASRLVASDH